jgi:hypothetical protein
MPQELQIARVMTNVRALRSDLEKYSHLVALQERNERLFYAVLAAHPEELKPIIYAPTVGQACVKYGLLFRRPRGLFISMADRGRKTGPKSTCASSASPTASACWAWATWASRRARRPAAGCCCSARGAARAEAYGVAR